jgi:hypothetical protein
MDGARNISNLPPSQGSIIPKFLFFIRTSYSRTSCCCGLFTLRTAIYIFAILDCVIGGFSALALLSLQSSPESVTTPEGLMLVIAAVMLFPASMGLLGASRTNAAQVTKYYYGKVGQLFALPLLEIWNLKITTAARQQSLSLGGWLTSLLMMSFEWALLAYVAHICFSYVNWVAQGQTVLANNGREMMEMMEQYRGQAAALNYPAQAVVVGAPIASSVPVTGISPPSKVEIQVGEPIPQAPA